MFQFTMQPITSLTVPVPHVSILGTPLDYLTHRVKVCVDDMPINPRKDYDNFGTMACWHRRYDLGDVQPRQLPDEYIADLPNGSLILPLFLIDHSGLSIRCGKDFSDCDPQGWDSGQVGIIHASPEDIAKEFGAGADATDKARKLLATEVETFDAYLQGDCYGFVIEDADGNHVDSCYGFLAYDTRTREGKQAMAESMAPSPEYIPALLAAIDNLDTWHDMDGEPIDPEGDGPDDDTDLLRVKMDAEKNLVKIN